jgi:Ser/Thr protein kinase RdoA (MazF antagonist)
MEMDKRTPIDRLNYEGNLDPVVGRLCAAYRVGKPTDFSVIDVGYEDCNVVITTPKDKYVAKIFSKGRGPQDITRYSTIMEKAVEAGVNHPPLMKTSSGDVVYTDAQANGLLMVLMGFIEGKSFLELNRAPNAEELQRVLEQAAKVNRIDHRPPYLFDSWAIPNIQVMFDKVKQYIKPEDIALVQQAMDRYTTIPVDDLPHCLVHGDFTKANVSKGDNDTVYILDFSVANWYPRIQELAVIAANLLHDPDNPMSLRDKSKIIGEEYNELNPLTVEEHLFLYDYALAGVAMEFMGAHQEKYINGNDTEETEFWLNLGRTGLQKELT